jgi:cobalt/nickel transport system permease protein
MFDLFSDFFAGKDNSLTRMDPRVKLVLSIVLIFSMLLSSSVLSPLVIACAAVSMTLIIGMPAKLIAVRLFAPLGIALAIIVLQTFLNGNEPLASFTLFGIHLTAKKEGLWHGMLLGSRVLGSVGVLILLGSVTPAYKIFHSLRWFRIPEGWVELALLIYRYTFILIDQAADVASAQRTRLGYSSAGRSMKSFGVLAGTVLTRSIDQAMRTSEAMTLRGYRGSMPFAPMPGLTRNESLQIFMGILAVVFGYLITERFFF